MPSSMVQSITDVDVCRETIRPANAEFLITGRGPFIANVTKIDFHRLWMQCLQENLPRVWHMAIPPVRSAIWFCGAPGPAVYAGGIELREPEIGLLPPSRTVWQRSTGFSQIGTMSLPVEDMAELSIALIGRDLSPRCGTVSIEASPSAAERLRRLHEAAGRLAETAPEIIANPDAARGLEQALIDAMFACLAQGCEREDTASRRRHSTIVKRFCALAAQNPGKSLYLTDVCTAIGVNQRTLHLCCQEHLGVGPKRYLMLRRMHLARRALLQTPSEPATVTEIATRYGFWELGRFSVTYKTMFGEAPSETLRHACG